MKRKSFLIALSALAIIAAVLIPAQRERAHIRARIETMRQALRENDARTVASLIASNKHSRIATTTDAELVEFFRMWLGTEHNRPWVSVDGDTAGVTPRPELHFGIIPGGNGLRMVKENGEWYFDGKLYID